MENISTMANINHMGGESFIMPPPSVLKRWGHAGLLLSAQYVLSVCLISVKSVQRKKNHIVFRTSVWGQTE